MKMEEKKEEIRFRGGFMPRVQEPVATVVQGSTIISQVVLKLVWNGEIRLVEVDHPLTVEAIKKKFVELFGVSPELTYTLPSDYDQISIKTEAELELAQRFGGQPLKVVGIMSEDVDEEMQEEEEDCDVYESASKSLAAHDVNAPADDIKKLLQVLDIKPRRLVKYGLASHKSLKKNKEGLNSADDANDDDDDDDMPDDEVATKVIDKWEVVDGDTNDHQAESDAVVSALRRRGVHLEPTVIHALLRILQVPPRRFIKVGLVTDIGTARKAYKEGGKLAAVKLFKEGPCHRKIMWGRGLAGGRGHGRGRGWAFAQDFPDCKKQKACSGPPHAFFGRHGPPPHGPPPHGPPHAFGAGPGFRGGHHQHRGCGGGGGPHCHHHRGHHGHHGPPNHGHWERGHHM